MKPQKKNTYVQLLDRLNELESEGRVNDIELARVERRAKSLQKVDSPGAFCVLGAIACLKGRLQESRWYHEKSIYWSNDNPHMIHNYGASLHRFGYLSEAMSYSLEAYSNTKNPEFLNLAILCAIHLGLHNYAKSLIEEWETLTSEEHEFRKNLNENDGEIRTEVKDLLSRDLTNDEDLWKELADT